MLTPRAMPQPETQSLVQPAIADDTTAPSEDGIPPHDLFHAITDKRTTPTLPAVTEDTSDDGENLRLDQAYRKTLSQREQDGALAWLMEGQQDEVEAGADPNEQRSWAQFGVDAAKDVGSMFVQDMDNVIIGGPLRAFQSTMRLADPVTAWLDANVFSGSALGFKDFSKPGEDGKAPEFTLPAIGDALEIPKTVSGSMLQSMTQFLTGFALAGGVAGKLGMGAATTVTGRAAQTMGLGMLSDFAAFDGHESRLSNFIEQFPSLQNPVTAYLKADEKDGEYEGRLKNVLEGMFGNAVMELVFAGVRSIKAARKQKALLGGGTYEEAAQKLAKGGVDAADATPIPDVGAKITQTLGDTAPEAPVYKPPEDVFEKFAIETGVPDDFTARGMVRTATEGDMTPKVVTPSGDTIRLYHGSDADFTEFDISRAGTKEGTRQGRGVNLTESADRARMFGKKLYEADVTVDRASFLDLDKPLSEQSPKVRKALEQAGVKDVPAPAEVFASIGDAAQWATRNGIEEANYVKVDGGYKIEFLYTKSLPIGDEAFSKKLQEAGLSGYKSEVAPGKADFVVFDPAAVKIRSRDGKPVAGATTGTPDPAPGTTRVYQGYWGDNPRDLEGVGGLVFTTNKENVDSYLISTKGKVWYVDIPNDRMKDIRDLDAATNAAQQPGKIFSDKQPNLVKLPEDIAKTRQEYTVGGKVEAPAEGTTRVYMAGPPGYTGAPYINWAKINTPQDIKSIIGQMASAQVDEITAKQRGVRTNATTITAAGKEDAWKILEGQRKIPLPSAEEQLALRNLWASSGQKLMETAKAAANGTPEDLFNFRRMMAVHNSIQQEVLGIRTETARALQQWNIPAGGNREMMRQLQDVMRQSGGEDVSRMLAQRVAALDGKEGFETAIEEIVRKGWGAKTADAVREVWINALLSGPKTHIVNFMSNSLVGVQSVMERAIAGRLGDIVSPVDGVKIGEATAMMWGVRQSFKEALVNAYRSYRTGQVGFGTSKVEGPRIRAISRESFGSPGKISEAANWRQATGTMLAKGLDLLATATGEVYGKPMRAVGPTIDNMILGSDAGLPRSRGLDALGDFVSIPGRALGAADEFFKTINYRAELWAQALRQADEEVMRGVIQKSDLKKRMVELITDAPETLKLRAQDMAAYNTFTNDPGPLVNSFMKFRDRVPGGWIIAPFVQTPANIFKFTMERTPLAPILNSFRADVLAGGARRDLALARMGLGTIIMTSVLDLAVDGHFTGSGPAGDKNSSQRATLRRSGWQPYSIRVQTGVSEDGTPQYRYFAYNRLDPVGSTIALAADLGEYLRNSDGRVDPEFEEIFAATVLGAAQTFMDKSYLFGLSSLMDALHNPDRMGESYFTRILSSFVPTGVKEVAVSLDPTARHVTDLVSALKARTPGLTKDLPPRLDFWGREVSYQSGLGTGYDVFSPIYSKSTKNAQPIDREFFTLAYFPRHPRDIRIGSISIPLRNMPDVENRWVELTNGSAADLLQETGDELRKTKRAHVARALETYGNRTLLETLNELVTNNEQYAELDADSKQKALERVVTMYRTAAKVQLLREKPRVLEVAKTIKPREERGIEAPF